VKRSPLVRRTPLQRRTPLRAMSPKRRKVNRLRKEMVRHELTKRPVCEAGPKIGSYRLERHGMEYAIRLAVGSPCTTRAVEIHEPLTRARGGSILDPANTVALCRVCHDWIHDHPEGAAAIGLLEASK
jgi:hypothetical protein